MHILSIRRSYAPSEIALFDIEITEHLRLFNVALTRNSAGELRSFAPDARGKRAATFHPTLGRMITDAAVAALSAGGNRHVG
jgi:hypothetical protein